MVPELRPRGIGEMLDVSVALYRARFLRLMAVALIVVIPVQIVSTIVLLSAQPDSVDTGFGNFSGTPNAQFDGGSFAVQVGAFVVILLIGVVSTAFVVAVCARIVADAYVDRGEATKEALRVVRRRVFAILGISLLVALSQFAIITIVIFAIAVPVLILENTPVFKALGRSTSLTMPSFWRAAGLIISSQTLASILSLGFGALIGLFFLDSGSDGSIVAQGFANTIASVLTTPFLAAVAVVLYFDTRIRAEGFDVQLLMQRDDARLAA